MGKSRRKHFSRAEMQAEIEQLSRDRYNERCRADTYAHAADQLEVRLRGSELLLEHERQHRRAAEESSAQALRAQRAAERRLLALLDQFLGLPAEKWFPDPPPYTREDGHNG